MKVLITPDKFKGTLTARQVSKAIAKGWKKARRTDTLDFAPMCDGGDGFGELLGDLLGGKPQKVKTADAAGRPITSRWWWVEESKTAIVESALTIGIALLPTGKYHPFDLDTYGLGAVLKAARAKGASRLLIGIGGSATNDAGFGMARSLGWRFLNKTGEEIEDWHGLRHLSSVLRPKPFRLFKSVRVAVDVTNPLLGARGCSRIFGPQKGLKEEDMKPSNNALRQLAKVLENDFGYDHAKMPGAGAAGGLGFGLASFLGGKFESGFDLFAGEANLNQRIASADLVITGEGSLDKSSMMGKGVSGILEICSKHGKPCVGIAGRVLDRKRLEKHFLLLEGLTDSEATEKQAMTDPEPYLAMLGEKMARLVD